MSSNKKKKPKVSIIYVLYKQLDDLLGSIASVKSSKPKCKLEIIVVDNEGKESNKNRILKAFRK
jgi:GT2 family glycosyltransferase